ncbi:MAG: hypothetical protein ACKODB_11425 [Betaproteobacteria bacterium]
MIWGHHPASGEVRMTNSRANASRLNGAKSSGPITPEGRERSGRNALKLGIFAKRRLLPDEDPAEFQELFDSLIETFNPASSVELMFIDRMAMARWRLSRVERGETAAIELRQYAYHTSSEEQKWRRFVGLVSVNNIVAQNSETHQKYVAQRDATIIASLGVADDSEKFMRLTNSLNLAVESALKQPREEQSRRVGSIELQTSGPRVAEGDAVMGDPPIDV